MRTTLWLVFLVAQGACNKDGGTGRMDRSRQFVCDSNSRGTVIPQRLVLTEAQAKDWGSGFEASGNCDAEVTNIELRSPTVALRAGGNSKLVLKGGIIEGGTYAIEVSGNAVVDLRGTEVIGKVKKSANGKVLGLEKAEGASAKKKPSKGKTKAKAKKKGQK